MSCPFRSYVIGLGRKLGMTASEVLAKHNSAELAEQMAYDLTQSEDWLNHYREYMEQERVNNMTPEETMDYLMSLSISKEG